MHDALAAQMNLWCCRVVIHRNISDQTIKASVPGNKGYENQAPYNPEKMIAPYIKELLGEPMPPDNPNQFAECLITDFEDCVLLGAPELYDDARTRTGTPGFMARSVAQTQLLPIKRSMIYPSMPTFPKCFHFDSYKAFRGYQNLGDYELYGPSTRRMFADRVEGRFQTPKQFRHYPFHDAESTLWVITRWLVHAIPADSQDSHSENAAYKKICTAMYATSPEARTLFPAAADWRKFLHPGLPPQLATMLGEMHRYLMPEWAMLPDLRPDHAHEALRRLVYKEIMRMKNAGELGQVAEHRRPIHPEVVPVEEEESSSTGVIPAMGQELIDAIKQLGYLISTNSGTEANEPDVDE
ncbi:hypothetical protein FRC09_008113 [Ceratobasidium sp. 395]|nr:hypothetical protein FRC09_008113 [Ceratobasidium sp. 395]